MHLIESYEMDPFIYFFKWRHRIMEVSAIKHTLTKAEWGKTSVCWLLKQDVSAAVWAELVEQSKWERFRDGLLFGEAK